MLEHRARHKGTAGMKMISHGPHEFYFPAVSLQSPSRSRRMYVRHGCVGVKKRGRYSVLCTSDIQTGCRAGDKAVHLILEA